MARYEGSAAWYDEHVARYTASAGDVVERLLGRGSGRCLDLCCGTGVHLQGLLGLGWRVTGVDISADQLRLARDRAGEGVELVRVNAAAMPFPDGHFDAVVSLFSPTDVDDFSAVVYEGARVLRAGGRSSTSGYTLASSAHTHATDRIALPGASSRLLREGPLPGCARHRARRAVGKSLWHAPTARCRAAAIPRRPTAPRHDRRAQRRGRGVSEADRPPGATSKLERRLRVRTVV
jgi:SAM-dependent methyltransferase